MSQDKMLSLIADLAEHLAIELLAEFEEEDYVHLDHTIVKIIEAEKILNEHHQFVPFSIKQVIKNYRKQTN